MTIDLTTLGQRLSAARANCGLTQDEAANLMGLPRTAVVQIEAGRRSVSTLELAEFARNYRTNIVEFFEPTPSREDPLVALGRVAREIHESADVSASIRLCLDLFREGVALERALQRERRPPPPSHAAEVATSTQAVEQGLAAAETERKRLELGDAPIADMCRLISEQGIWATGAALPNDGFSGLFLNHPAIGLAVVVNHAHPLPRKRFSYAHEYAHALFDREKTVTYTAKSNAGDLFERRANAFAAAFLVPRHGVAAVLEALQKGGPSRRAYSTYDVASDEAQEVEKRAVPGSQGITFREAGAVAHHFGVSYEVACYRLKDLGRINKNELEALLQKKEVGREYIALLGDGEALPHESDDRRKELVSQLIPLALEAFDRELISRGKLRELAAKLGLRETDVLRFA